MRVPNEMSSHVASRTVCPGWRQAEGMEMAVYDGSITYMESQELGLTRGRLAGGARTGGRGARLAFSFFRAFGDALVEEV